VPYFLIQTASSAIFPIKAPIFISPLRNCWDFRVGVYELKYMQLCLNDDKEKRKIRIINMTDTMLNFYFYSFSSVFRLSAKIPINIPAKHNEKYSHGLRNSVWMMRSIFFRKHGETPSAVLFVGIIGFVLFPSLSGKVELLFEFTRFRSFQLNPWKEFPFSRENTEFSLLMQARQNARAERL